jgi:nucleotide-binding universal stress UspA family protein
MSNVVIAGVDGSETAARAALTAARLASALDAELLVVCAYEKLEIERVETDGNEYAFSTADSAQELAADSIKSLLARYSGLRATAMAEKGSPTQALLRVAEDSGAELIVVGNKRVQGVARILGSIATDIAHKAPCDVYIAHTHTGGSSGEATRPGSPGPS